MRGFALVICVIVPVAAGCAVGNRTTRVADVGAGNFYTQDEIRGLSQEKRNLYCAQLEKEIANLRREAAILEVQADSIAAVSDSLREANAAVTTEIRDLDGEIRQLRLARRASTTYVVKAGDTLHKIAEAVYGQSSRWQDVYQANRETISDPLEQLKPGTRLVIPAK